MNGERERVSVAGGAHQWSHESLLAASGAAAVAELGVDELRERVQVLCRLVAELTEMAAGRAPIEQAKGVLMASCGVTAEQAFVLLRTRSQKTNTVLREVAAQLVEDTVTRYHSDGALRAHEVGAANR